jgi:hypothetical protein
MDVVPSRDRRVVDISLTLMTSKPRSTSPSAMSFTGVYRQVWEHCLDGPFRFRVEGVVGQVIGFEVAFH